MRASTPKTKDWRPEPRATEVDRRRRLASRNSSGSDRKYAKEMDRQRARAKSGNDAGEWVDNEDEFEMDEEGVRRSEWAKARAKKDRQQAY